MRALVAARRAKDALGQLAAVASSSSPVIWALFGSWGGRKALQALREAAVDQVLAQLAAGERGNVALAELARCTLLTGPPGGAAEPGSGGSGFLPQRIKGELWARVSRDLCSQVNTRRRGVGRRSQSHVPLQPVPRVCR
jgi:hypothetical protein